MSCPEKSRQNLYLLIVTIIISFFRVILYFRIYYRYTFLMTGEQIRQVFSGKYNPQGGDFP